MPLDVVGAFALIGGVLGLCACVLAAQCVRKAAHSAVSAKLGAESMQKFMMRIEECEASAVVWRVTAEGLREEARSYFERGERKRASAAGSEKRRQDRVEEQEDVSVPDRATVRALRRSGRVA